MNLSRLSRRQFITRAAAFGAAGGFLPSMTRAQTGGGGANDKVQIAAIGWGMQGPGNTQQFIQNPDCRVVAVCDVDAPVLEKGVGYVNKAYGNQDCKGYADYRELLARDDIDAVMIAVPDHWHALISIEAAKRKKDIYGEKPLAKTIAEQQAIVRAAEANGIIWQTGSWQRSVPEFRRACEIVRNGLIGRVRTVEVGLPSGHTDFAGSGMNFDPAPVPEGFDYDRWIGPAKMMDYIPARVHRNWRWNYNTGGGQLMDWIGHHGDIAHWGLGLDDSGPFEVSGEGDGPPPDAVWNTLNKFRIEAKYPEDLLMIIAGGVEGISGGTKWIGTDGWVRVDRGAFEASNPEWLKGDLPDDVRKVRLPAVESHYKNFIDCVKSREPTLTPARVAHHSAIPGHLGQIAIDLGETIKWDAAKEEIIGNETASRMLGREYREPWKLES